MPCAAPCNRLPCEKRCLKELPCGHQCPGLCGEVCPVGYCQTCGQKADSRVDMLEFKTYGEIDVDEEPVVVLNCGHFFTAETLDGIVGLHDVYETDRRGQISGLKDFSRELAVKAPRCPDCQCPIRQYATQRFNRVINRAVIDEMSKRFIVHGQAELRNLAAEVTALENELAQSPTMPAAGIQDRYKNLEAAEGKARKLQKEFARQHQPNKKLHDAIVRAERKNAKLEDGMDNLTMSQSMEHPDIDQRIIVASRLMEIQISCIILEDKFTMFSKASGKPSPFSPEKSPLHTTPSTLDLCQKLIEDSTQSKLPKYTVEATLFYYRIASRYSLSGSKTDAERRKANDYRETVLNLLENAKDLTQNGSFQGAKELGQAVQNASALLGRERYEEVTQAEIDAIKAAMLSGPGGMATHSGHWYNCENGHPVSTDYSTCRMEVILTVF